MPLIRRLALLCWLLLAAGTAHAACAVASTAAADIGTRTSYDMRAGGIAAVASAPTLSCTGGSLLSLTANDYVTATTTSTNAFRLRSASGDTIAYRLAADAAGSFVFTQGGSINYLGSTTINLLGLLANTSFAIPFYAQLTEAPNLPAGTYTDTVSVTWSWTICRGVGLGDICVLQDRGTGTATMTISVTVTKDCRISAPPVSFGSAPLARSFAPVTQAVAIDCTKGSAFSVAFTAGTSGASRPWRRMRDGRGNTLRYNLYRPDGTTIWDEQSPLPSANAGTGATTPALLHTYVAKVDLDQPTPPAGSYTDTVSVLVTF